MVRLCSVVCCILLWLKFGFLIGGLFGVSPVSAAEPPTLRSFFGSTPNIDGQIKPDEWRDATSFVGVKDWIHTFSPTTDPADLSLKGWVKHDEQNLYFAFDVTDNLLYGIDTERWLPKENARAHDLTAQGYPWFGDELEILLNSRNTWTNDESVSGDGGSWQMVCNVTKSRLGGIGVGGLLEGEPRSDAKVFARYQKWIESKDQQCAVTIKPDRAGYWMEWSIRFQPGLELEQGKFYRPSMGRRVVGLNIAVGDLDRKEDGTGNFGNFHHEDWFSGTPKERTQLRHFGRLIIEGKKRR
jgi:solute:Na+ symporter, SSS family